MNGILKGSRAFFVWVLALQAWLALDIAWCATLVDGPDIHAISATNAIVRWTTDVATGGRVRYGIDPSNLTQSAQDGVSARHSVTLSGLKPGAKYHFVISTARSALATNSFSTLGGSQIMEPSPKAKSSVRGEPAPTVERKAPSTRETWGYLGGLRDHFERHGADFKAKDPDDYARQAWEFLQRARAEGLPAKIDNDGVIRIFDPKTGAFAAYNRNGTTRTYFKPNSRDYFERQPGRSVSAKNLQF